jgi:replicative DNA helicase
MTFIASSHTLSNLEVEAAVLGAVLGDASGNLAPQVLPFLRPEHFSDALHARIFETITKIWSVGGSTSVLGIKSYLEGDATLKDLGGMSFLSSLIANACIPVSLKSNCDLLRDLAARRSAADLSSDLAKSATALEPGASFRPVLADHIERLQILFDDGDGRKTGYTLGEAAQALVERVQRIRAGEIDRNAIRTGIAALDHFTGGLHRGEYVILGGRPSMGKTAVAVQIARNVAERGGGVFYSSQEMPVHLLVPRFVSCRLWTPGGATNVDYQRILHGQVSDMQIRWISSISQELDGFPLFIDDAPGMSAAELEARAQVAKSKLERKGLSLDLVIVDHLHKMRHSSALSKVSEYTEISSRLAEMAKRLDCPVVALAQLNRSVEGRDNKRPQLADLRESGSIEQDADTVMFCYRPAYYLERQRCDDPMREANRLAELDKVAHHLELIIEKQRSGPIGTVELYCDMASNVIRDLADMPAGVEKAA